MTDVFISYKKEDAERVAPIARALAQAGYEVWWDHRIPAGRTYREVIGAAVDSARCVIVVWSKLSAESQWVLDEADAGKQRNVLLPVMLDEVSIPMGFRQIESARLIGWRGDANAPEWRNVLESVAHFVGRAPGGPPKPFMTPSARPSRRDAPARSGSGGMIIAVIALLAAGGAGFGAWKMGLFGPTQVAEAPVTEPAQPGATASKPPAVSPTPTDKATAPSQPAGTLPSGATPSGAAPEPSAPAPSVPAPSVPAPQASAPSEPPPQAAPASTGDALSKFGSSTIIRRPAGGLDLSRIGAATKEMAPAPAASPVTRVNPAVLAQRPVSIDPAVKTAADATRMRTLAPAIGTLAVASLGTTAGVVQVSFKDGGGLVKQGDVWVELAQNGAPNGYRWSEHSRSDSVILLEDASRGARIRVNFPERAVYLYFPDWGTFRKQWDIATVRRTGQ